MNFDQETMQRFRRKLMNATNAIQDLAVFLDVHNDDDESPKFRRGREAQDELDAMVRTLCAMFTRTSKEMKR